MVLESNVIIFLQNHITRIADIKKINIFLKKKQKKFRNGTPNSSRYVKGFTKFVQIGRVVRIVYGKDEGKLATIVDILNDKRVLIDGPTSGVARQIIPIRRLSLTSFHLKDVLRGQRSVLLKYTSNPETIGRRSKSSISTSKPSKPLTPERRPERRPAHPSLTSRDSKSWSSGRGYRNTHKFFRDQTSSDIKSESSPRTPRLLPNPPLLRTPAKENKRSEQPHVEKLSVKYIH
jgi:large subunit ribosomal protein L14e